MGILMGKEHHINPGGPIFIIDGGETYAIH